MSIELLQGAEGSDLFRSQTSALVQIAVEFGGEFELVGWATSKLAMAVQHRSPFSTQPTRLGGGSGSLLGYAPPLSRISVRCEASQTSLVISEIISRVPGAGFFDWEPADVTRSALRIEHPPISVSCKHLETQSAGMHLYPRELESNEEGMSEVQAVLSGNINPTLRWTVKTTAEPSELFLGILDGIRLLLHQPYDHDLCALLEEWVGEYEASVRKPAFSDHSLSCDRRTQEALVAFLALACTGPFEDVDFGDAQQFGHPWTRSDLAAASRLAQRVNDLLVQVDALAARHPLYPAQQKLGLGADWSMMVVRSGEQLDVSAELVHSPSMRAKDFMEQWLEGAGSESMDPVAEGIGNLFLAPVVAIAVEPPDPCCQYRDFADGFIEIVYAQGSASQSYQTLALTLNEDDSDAELAHTTFLGGDIVSLRLDHGYLRQLRRSAGSVHVSLPI